MQVIATASWVALMRIVAPYGSAALAGYTIAVRIAVFALLPSWGLANAEASLRIISYGYVFYAWGMVLTQAFNDAGDTTTPTCINLFCFWMLQIPLAWFLAGGAGFGPRGVFWAVAVAESVLAVAAAVIFRRGKWKTREV